jgi:glycosyltransferase involved in cell wall biosynthesis
MRTLVVTNRPVILTRHGYDLRVANLARHLPGEKHLVHVPIAPPDHRPATLDAGSIFHSVRSLEADFHSSPSVRRHFRMSECGYLGLAFPQATRLAREALRRLVDEKRITHLVVFGSHLAELTRDLPCEHALFDVCDSVALTLRRALEFHQPRRSLRERMRGRLELERWRRFEGALPSWFPAVTTINGADTEEVRTLSGGARNVYTLPNGVAETFLRPLPPASTRRAVAFWGNLNFPPNAEALRFFMHRVYAPHLAGRSVEVVIAGDKAPGWLVDMARDDRCIKVLGFVDDLAAAVSGCPVMINPMLIGSGMKNKVLEAFAMGLAVVSTTLGMESVADAREGVHFARADEPERFAEAVLSLLDDPAQAASMREAAHQLVHDAYRWEAISRRLVDLLETRPASVVAR